MPKRPCMVRVTADGKSILSGDKFGDVYLLPVTPDPSYAFRKKKREYEGPSASALTVHSQRNLNALKMQEIQKKLNPQVSKEAPDFEHHLLIGHVSMLTNLLYTEYDIEGKKRPFILTTDRDEHIRVSRGPPQTHVIQSYCLGHTEFVSQIHIPKSRPELLVSGGGDGQVILWDWQSGQVLQKIDAKSQVGQMLGEEEGKVERAISKIWSLGDVVLVAFERYVLKM